MRLSGTDLVHKLTASKGCAKRPSGDWQPSKARRPVSRTLTIVQLVAAVDSSNGDRFELRALAAGIMDEK
jgi:hypothetical protein